MLSPKQYLESEAPKWWASFNEKLYTKFIIERWFRGITVLNRGKRPKHIAYSMKPDGSIFLDSWAKIPDHYLPVR